MGGGVDSASALEGFTPQPSAPLNRQPYRAKVRTSKFYLLNCHGTDV